MLPDPHKYQLSQHMSLWQIIRPGMATQAANMQVCIRDLDWRMCRCVHKVVMTAIASFTCDLLVIRRTVARITRQSRVKPHNRRASVELY